jgi:methionyl-tRNA formyltransferase
MFISAQGAQIEVAMVRPEEGKKVSAAQFCAQAGVAVGTMLGT